MVKPLILVATNNPGKVRELEALLGKLPIKLVRPLDLGLQMDVAETGATYAENARLKARAFATRSGMISLADDSGLEISALKNWPGIYSARCDGPDASDAERRALVLSRLAGRPSKERGARFVCQVAVASPSGVLAETRGVLEGEIALAASGAGGFGFDAIFIPRGLSRTLAEVPEEEKNQISHRARAIKDLRPFLERLSGPVH